MKKQRAMKEVMYALFFRITRLQAVILDGQKIDTATWYTQHYMLEILQKCKIKV